MHSSVVPGMCSNEAKSFKCKGFGRAIHLYLLCFPIVNEIIYIAINTKILVLGSGKNLFTERLFLINNSI